MTVHLIYNCSVWVTGVAVLVTARIRVAWIHVRYVWMVQFDIYLIIHDLHFAEARGDVGDKTRSTVCLLCNYAVRKAL